MLVINVDHSLSRSTDNGCNHEMCGVRKSKLINVSRACAESPLGASYRGTTVCGGGSIPTRRHKRIIKPIAKPAIPMGPTTWVSGLVVIHVIKP